jgi:hypothetical protein
MGISFGSISAAHLVQVANDPKSAVSPVHDGTASIQQSATEDSEKQDSNESIVSVFSLLLFTICRRMQIGQSTKVRNYHTQ